jgi:hypothetical protein
MRTNVVGAGLIFGTLFAHAQANPTQGTRAITLQESILLTLVRNLDFQIQRLSTDIARFNLSGSWRHQLKLEAR